MELYQIEKWVNSFDFNITIEVMLPIMMVVQNLSVNLQKMGEVKNIMKHRDAFLTSLSGTFFGSNV